MRAVADEVAAAVDALDAELVDAIERGLQRREVGVDVGDDRDARCRSVRAMDSRCAIVSIDNVSIQSVFIYRWLSIWSWLRRPSAPPGERCCEPVVYPDVEREQAARIAAVAKALGDPIRLQLVDVLRKHAGKVCVCELVPLFDISQPTLCHHLKKLREAGIVDSERRGLWAYYYVLPDALKELSAWLS